MSGIRWVALSSPVLPFSPPLRRANRLWTIVSTLLFVFCILHSWVHTDVQQRPAPGPPKRPQQPTPVTQSNSTMTTPTTPSSSRNAPPPPSNRPGIDRSVSTRTQPKTNSPAMSRSNTTKEARSTTDHHTPHQQQPPARQSANQSQSQTLQTPTKSKAKANAKSSPSNSSTDLKAHHKPRQSAHQTHHKPGTGLNPPGAAPRRREKKDKEDDSDIIRRLQQICTDADPTRLYRNLVKIGAG